jgi:hypothetical protein
VKFRRIGLSGTSSADYVWGLEKSSARFAIGAIVPIGYYSNRLH